MSENFNADFLATNFGLQPVDNTSMEEIETLLTAEIKHLLEYEFEKLKHILYRIDVDENKFYDAVAKPDAAKQIARLIIERQIQKAISRKNNS